jgi:hypothetical protein
LALTVLDAMTYAANGLARPGGGSRWRSSRASVADAELVDELVGSP